MTKQEKAIKEIRSCLGVNNIIMPHSDEMVAFGMAIEALKKQIPKKPEYYGDEEDGKILCPSCGTDLWDLKECGFNGCPYCLQAIDWSEEE